MSELSKVGQIMNVSLIIGVIGSMISLVGITTKDVNGIAVVIVGSAILIYSAILMHAAMVYIALKEAGGN